MLKLLRRRNFALLWFGGFISLMGDWVLMTALPYFVYQQSGSTLASAAMVTAELLPRLLLGSLAGVFADRWNRKRLMVIASMCQGIVILPLLWVPATNELWIVYVVSFFQTMLALFFAPAENALLPLLVDPTDLLPANSLNALNNSFARLIGPPVGGILLTLGGLSGVIFFDSLTFLIGGLLILLIRLPMPAKQAETTEPQPQRTGWSQFWQEWRAGLSLVHHSRVVTVLFITVVLLNLGGVMLDPLWAPYIVDVVQAGAGMFGVLATVQAIGGILGGVLAAKFGSRWAPSRLYGWAEIVLGLGMLIRFNIPQLPMVFAMSLFVGLPAALGVAALETLFQQKVPNSHLGRISGALTTTIGLVSLFGVLGVSGVLGETLGVVPVLNIASLITILAGVMALILLPAHE